MAILRYPNWLWPDFSSAMEDFEKARRQMERFLSSFTESGAAAPVVSGVFPPIVVRENDDKIIIEAEIPGIKADDIDISVNGKTLTLTGERKPEEAQNVSFHRRERKWGSFRKAVTLPDNVNTDGIQAECKNGVLRIVLPKAEQAKPKKIEIKSE